MPNNSCSSFERKVRAFVSEWERRCYHGGIPDEACPRLEQFGKVPSYRRIVRAIIRNDITGKTLGFEQNRGNIYGAIKREEIAQRKNSQQNLFP